MTPKRASFMTYGEDPQCAEIKKFITDAGVILDIRDLEKKPLTEYELDKLIGFLEITHFLNPMSGSYKKLDYDTKHPERDEIIKVMAKDHTLIRRPIIKTNRLLTVGCDRKKICEMLQISPNGKPDDERENNIGRQEPASTPNK